MGTEGRVSAGLVFIAVLAVVWLSSPPFGTQSSCHGHPACNPHPQCVHGESPSQLVNASMTRRCRCSDV